MSGECGKCMEHCLDCACDKKWLCAECFKKSFNLDDEFDWRKVGIVYFRCHKCGDDPVIFVDYDDMIMCKESKK
jgi:hypothetical protein